MRRSGHTQRPGFVVRAGPVGAVIDLADHRRLRRGPEVVDLPALRRALVDLVTQARSSHPD
jgi:hypothetical protein